MQQVGLNTQRAVRLVGLVWKITVFSAVWERMSRKTITRISSPDVMMLVKEAQQTARSVCARPIYITPCCCLSTVVPLDYRSLASLTRQTDQATAAPCPKLYIRRGLRKKWKNKYAYDSIQRYRRTAQLCCCCCFLSPRSEEGATFCSKNTHPLQQARGLAQHIPSPFKLALAPRRSMADPCTHELEAKHAVRFFFVFDLKFIDACFLTSDSLHPPKSHRMPHLAMRSTALLLHEEWSRSSAKGGRLFRQPRLGFEAVVWIAWGRLLGWVADEVWGLWRGWQAERVTELTFFFCGYIAGPIKSSYS